MCAQEQNPPVTTEKKILWLVLKEHKYWTWNNNGRLADLCATRDSESFQFAGEGILMLRCGKTDFTKVEIKLIDSPENIDAVSVQDTYPEMDMIVADQGDHCKMIRNRFGELKMFYWERKKSINLGNQVVFQDFIEPRTNQNM